MKPKADGFIYLDRPLAPGVARIRSNDPTFSDLAGVLTGVKPVTYTDCFPENIPALKELCEKLRLEFLPAEEFLGKKENHFKKAKKMILLGKDLKTLKAAAMAWSELSTKKRWARLLGYPGCCVKEYAKWACGKYEKKPRPDIIRRILGNTGKPAELNFKLNNLWNYFSRMDFTSPRDLSDYEMFMGFNRELELPSKHIISWHPCSYNCAESAKKAEIIFSFMKHHVPDHAAMLEAMLARPVLFWDKFQYACLDGRAAGGVVSYKAAVPPRSLLNEKIYKLIACCDTVKVGRAKVEFCRKDDPVFSSRTFKPVILNFGKVSGRVC